MFPTTVDMDDVADFVVSAHRNTPTIMEETEDDPLFAPINDIESIFADEPTMSALSRKFDATLLQPTPLHQMMPLGLFNLDERRQYQQRQAQTGAPVPLFSTSSGHCSTPSHAPKVDFLSNALDEMDDVASDFFPDEIDALSEFSADIPAIQSAALDRLPNFPPPRISGLTSFNHLKPPCIPKRRVVSDESAYASFKPIKTMEPIKRSKSSEGDAKFRVYQTEKWSVKFQELLDYRQIHGHCQVPHGYRPSPTLARWCKRQRYQYKLFLEEKPSTITHERVAALERIGFVWDSHTMLWKERLQELLDYIAEHGHANVPSTYSPNQKLAIWVKCQRRQYKLLLSGQPSNMTQERVDELNELGFIWEVRRTG
jgi:hypothetical protein